MDKSFAKLCKQHGWASFESELTLVIETTTAATEGRNAELLRMLCLQRDKNEERIDGLPAYRKTVVQLPRLPCAGPA